MTWISGAVTFLVAIPCAFTGYVSQQNFDAQWISTQAKDGLNAVGVGAFFNVTNFGQMYSYHVLLLPAAVLGRWSARTSCSSAATASCRRSRSRGADEAAVSALAAYRAAGAPRTSGESLEGRATAATTSSRRP